jgi:hypothetical protein
MRHQGESERQREREGGGEPRMEKNDAMAQHGELLELSLYSHPMISSFLRTRNSLMSRALFIEIRGNLGGDTGTNR